MNLCNCDAKVPASQCGCSKELPAPDQGVQLAIATVPMQPWETPYEPSKALKQGTIFPPGSAVFIVGGEKMPTASCFSRLMKSVLLSMT